VFKLAPDGTETVLHSFAVGPSDGYAPYAGLIADRAGNLYGTTDFGGVSGNGAVFKLAPDGTETVLYSFAGGPSDGLGPFGGLIADRAGNLYGTTAGGGASGNGGGVQARAGRHRDGAVLLCRWRQRRRRPPSGPDR